LTTVDVPESGQPPGLSRYTEWICLGQPRWKDRARIRAPESAGLVGAKDPPGMTPRQGGRIGGAAAVVYYSRHVRRRRLHLRAHEHLRGLAMPILEPSPTDAPAARAPALVVEAPATRGLLTYIEQLALLGISRNIS